MTEIRSTIDLVMERTKNMVQSSEEKAGTRARELDDQARGWLLALAEDRMRPGDVNLRLQDMPESERTGFREALIRVMIWNFHLEDENEPILTGLAMLAGDRLGPLIQEARALFRDYDEELGALEALAAGDALADLAKKGISGSALQPKAGAAPDRPDAVERLKVHYGAKLEKIQEDMRVLAGV
ncbi:MAG: hypothetical protein KKB20_23820 [Proteobacteria bacterium]|nr:hypothetical protein [Pseudomonadota bacterium]